MLNASAHCPKSNFPDTVPQTNKESVCLHNVHTMLAQCLYNDGTMSAQHLTKDICRHNVRTISFLGFQLVWTP